MNASPHPAPGAWDDALLCAAMLAVDPAGLRGIHLRARHGPVRDRWLEAAVPMFGSDAPVRRVAAGIDQNRLTGGLDIGLTVEKGRPVVEKGVLAAAHGGVTVVAMAERLDRLAVAAIAAALDDGEVRIERDGISARMPARFAFVALDESADEDEILAAPLADRLALRADLNAVGWRDAEARPALLNLEDARALLPSVGVSSDMVAALCGLCASFGEASLRTPLHLLRAARAAAALRGSAIVEPEDAAASIRVVLGPIAPPPAEEEEEEEGEADQSRTEDAQGGADNADGDGGETTTDASQEMLIEAVEAALPKDLLLRLQAGAARRAGHQAGRAGAARDQGAHGRVVGVTARPPRPGARLDVLATLRQAAPWQRIRAEAAEVSQPGRLAIRREDFRFLRRRSKTGTVAIFAVDASGSAAFERLAETKGAIERLLAECYVRRDSVALVSFRGREAETLLEPTRSLVRAKRCLSSLPGGGGTPLASGILSSLRLASSCLRKGQSVLVVFLTDGRGNVALDGTSTRAGVAEDTARAARQFKAASIRCMLIDTARRPQERAIELARDLGADYLAMPHGRAEAMARAVGSAMEG